MSKRDLLKLPDDFEANMRALLATAPAPHDTAGSRKAAPKPPAKPKARKRKGYRRTKAEAAARRAVGSEGVRYEYETAAVKKTQRPKKR
jgi:hypothetical protein